MKLSHRRIVSTNKKKVSPVLRVTVRGLSRSNVSRRRFVRCVAFTVGRASVLPGCACERFRNPAKEDQGVLRTTPKDFVDFEIGFGRERKSHRFVGATTERTGAARQWQQILIQWSINQPKKASIKRPYKSVL
ncbi:hypothetical protein quinque_012716 [Culex quinquefasciatus]